MTIILDVVDGQWVMDEILDRQGPIPLLVICDIL